jgi:hypothetical protein
MAIDPRSTALAFINDVINGGELDALANYVSPLFIDQTNDPGVVLGIEGLRESLITTRVRLNGFQMTVDDTIAESNKITLRSTVTYTPRNQPSRVLKGIDIYSFDDNGLIAERWGTW